jgi:hypothetical protein
VQRNGRGQLRAVGALAAGGMRVCTIARWPRARERHVVTNPTRDNGPVRRSGNLCQASILSGLEMKPVRCSEAFQSSVLLARARAAALID